MMLEHLGEAAAAKQLMSVIEAVTENGLYTPDLGGTASTRQVTDAVIELIKR
ncbi:putative tartrate dehydrogenase/decarboxylase TtuC' [compost metagenome]